MINVIPDGEKLKEKLTRFKSEIFLELPEVNNHLWKQLRLLLEMNLPKGFKKEDLNVWQLKVVLIARDEYYG